VALEVGRVEAIFRYPVKSIEMLRAVARANGNTAGIYATVTRAGRLEVGQALFLRQAT
jgi:uncharacterized protein YcbX